MHPDYDEFPEPTRPTYPPAGVTLPEDLAAALDAFRAADDAWLTAVEAVEEYRTQARQSRAARAAAVRAAGDAVASGRKRPAIPDEITEAAERTEVEILSRVVAVRREEANRAARAASALVAAHAGEWVEPVGAGFRPAIAEAQAKIDEAIAAVARAENIVSEVARLRATAYTETLREVGEFVGRDTLRDSAASFWEAISSRAYRVRVARHATPADALADAKHALEALAESDLAEVPHPDTLGAVSGRPSWTAWHRVFSAAPAAVRERLATALRLGD
ncbi:hypothetical protein ACGFI9_20830 [Micromonospora sp. NPDC048930]|uniref:hypothetical protein n=1 Tax=Micromonospora sp. NPDC048930 TaxID=3364261 RepID=UPI00371D2C3D